MADIETIKRRIKALLAKKNGGTEAEIASALAMAKSMMGEWRLSEADLASNPESKPLIKEMRLKPRASPPTWEMLIGNICQELFQVRSFTRSGDWLNDKTTLCFVGYPQDLELAVEMFAVIKSQILPLCTAYSKAGATYGERCRFGHGIVSRILSNLEKARLAVKEEEDAKCRALVVSRNAEVDAYCEKNLKLQTRKKRIQAGDPHYSAGWDVGAKIDLGIGKKKLTHQGV